MLFHSTATTILTPLVGLAVLLANTASAAPSPAAPVLETRKWLSNIDVGRACRDQYGHEFYPTRVGDSCWDWRCEVNRESKSVSMEVYCDSLYGANNAYSSCGGGTVWDWQCHN